MLRGKSLLRTRNDENFYIYQISDDACHKLEKKEGENEE